MPLPTRFYRPRTEPERPRPLVSMDNAPTAESRDYVYSVGATLDSRTVPEIMIGDEPRGALSYAVARALEGQADLDRNGTVMAGEFEAFVTQNVRSLSASKQTPQFDMPEEAFPFFSRIPEVVPDKVSSDKLRVYIRPGADQSFLDAIAGVGGVTLVDEEAAAHLVFDPATGAVANTTRDLVAEGLDLAGLKTAIQADRALKVLQQLALRATLPIAFSPGDAVHPEGTQIGFSVADVGGRYLATGSIHFLWPTSPADSDPIASGGSFSLDAMVTPPFGADNLVVLATDAPPTSLRDDLKRFDGGRDPAALIASLRVTAANQPLRHRNTGIFHEAEMTLVREKRLLRRHEPQPPGAAPTSKCGQTCFSVDAETACSAA